VEGFHEAEAFDVADKAEGYKPSSITTTKKAARIGRLAPDPPISSSSVVDG
jgi:hypothetical protein